MSDPADFTCPFCHQVVPFPLGYSKHLADECLGLEAELLRSSQVAQDGFERHIRRAAEPDAPQGGERS